MERPELAMRQRLLSHTPKQRVLSCIAMCLTILIVLAHNVYHSIPNEVPILFVLAIVSFRIREGRWLANLYDPAPWRRTVLLALLGVVLLQVKYMILEPVGQHFWRDREHISLVITQSRDIRRALRNVLFVWLFAAFGEEIGYRGYLLRRAVHVFGIGPNFPFSTDSRSAT